MPGGFLPPYRTIPPQSNKSLIYKEKSMEYIIVIGLLIAMWIIALAPVEKLSKKLQNKGILEQDYKKD